MFSKGALSPIGIRITKGASYKRQIVGFLVGPTRSAPGDLCLCKLPREFWGPQASLGRSLGWLRSSARQPRQALEFPFQMDPFAASVVVSCPCLWICVWFCNSSETCESLQIANPTCYHSVIVFGLVVMTEDADVTKTLALVLQTNVKHGQPYYISLLSFPLNGWHCFSPLWVEACSWSQMRADFQTHN